MLYVEFPAQCEAVYVSLVVENPSTGMRCTVDAKVDTGSPYTILPPDIISAIDLTPFCMEDLEAINGSPFKTAVCMGRIYLDDNNEYIDMAVHIADDEIAIPLLGMDILRKGDTAITHVEEDGNMWLRFTFNLLPEESRILL